MKTLKTDVNNGAAVAAATAMENDERFQRAKKKTSSFMHSKYGL